MLKQKAAASAAVGGSSGQVAPPTMPGPRWDTPTTAHDTPTSGDKIVAEKGYIQKEPKKRKRTSIDFCVKICKYDSG